MSGSAQQTAIDIGTPARPDVIGGAGIGARVIAYFSERRLHRSPEAMKEQVASRANAMTLARGIFATAALGVAAYSGLPGLFVAALVVSWVADIADGAIARRLRCETVFGAQLDAMVDRLTVLAVAVGSVLLAEGSALSIVAAIAVWIQFGFVDQLVFNQFLRYGLWTPDEFHLVNARVWRLNWSPIAKLAGGVPAGLIALGGDVAYVALAASLALIATRFGTYAHAQPLPYARVEWHH